MALEPGVIIDRYQVESLIGQGGMASVWKVRHTVLGTPHALKLLGITHPAVTARLVQEGRVQGQLAHPNVVQVTDVVTYNEQPGLVMEYVDGVDLDVWLQENKPDLAEVERVFRGICAGVAAAHARGLVHRDLKPANVLMARTESGPQVPKVADFGLAKAAAAEGPGQTRTGLAMGTPAFMAPEQIRDAAKVDARADIFSLGCILYQLACGETAFVGPDVVSVWNHICKGEYRAPREVDPKLPERFQRAIEGALRVDPDERIPSVGALLEVLEGEKVADVVSKAAGQGRSPDPFVMRWLIAASLTLGIGLVLAVGAFALAAGTWALRSPPVVDAPAAPDEEEGDPPPAAVPVADLPICPTESSTEAPLGWVRVASISPFRQPPREGSTLTLTDDAAVYDKVLGKQEICRLPKGTEVVIPRETVRRRGLWIALSAGGFTLPE